MEVTSESTRIFYARRRRGRQVGATGVRTTTEGRAREPGASPGMACAAQRTDSRTRTADHRSASPFMAAPRMAIFAGRPSYGYPQPPQYLRRRVHWTEH